MNFFRVLLFIYFFVLTFSGWAQTISVDTNQLKSVEVSSSRSNKFSSGNKTEILDSTILSRYSSNNLADLLANQSQIFIKSYGLGSLATTSFRGAGSGHTAVLWNGFNLQSPMNGQLDVALVPVHFLSDVKLQYGGSGALWGSGAVGGTIQLNNTALFNKGITVNAVSSFGSFSDNQQQAGVELSTKRVVSSYKWFTHSAKNDFPFINTAQYGKPEQKQSNAELEEYGFFQENYFYINKYQKLNTRLWHQFNNRNIPPSMTQNKNTANQKDEFWRATTEWQRTGEKLTLLARLAYFDENLIFLDPTISLNSQSHTKVTIVEGESRFSITKLDLVNIGINNTFSKAFFQDYIINPYQNRFALFANYKIHTPKNKWNFVLSARQEFIENKTIPLVVSAGFEGTLLKYFFIKANAAQHYRIPTFNDLYFQGQGGKGNPVLKPEIGWSEEGSLIHKYRYMNTSWELAATAFNRNIDNWILWIPVSSSVWSPKNIMEVWSRGVEYKLDFRYITGRFNIQLSGMYNYILSTNEKAATPTDVSLNKQLIYVPIQNSQGEISILYKGFSICYHQMYTGYRYTTSDNEEYLEPYSVGNVTVSEVFSISYIKMKLFFNINNIWNKTYQVMAYRAMPLINYQFGLTLYFNQPKP